MPRGLRHKDSTEVSTTSIDVSHPTKIPAATATTVSATTASQLPAAPATDSTDTETSIDGDGATASLPVRLWDRAYNDLKQEERGLVDVYEKILSWQLQDGPGSAVPESQPNTIAQNNSDARRRQMIQLIHAGLDKTSREATVKESLGVAVNVVLLARNIISSAIQAMPQAALAWTGICLALEVLANPITATEANRKGVDYVVKRMDWYWSLSSNLLKNPPDHADELSGVRSELENRIVDLYKVLLSYQVKSVCSYYRNRGLVFLRDVIKLDNWDADLGAIRDAERCFRDDTEIYNAQQATSHLEQLVSHARNQEMQHMSEKDQQCLNHLRLTDPFDDKTRIERTKGGLLKDSYRWVLDNSDFQQWRNHPESRLLWIKGNPGKGKTMLLCGIINELDRDSSADACRRNVAYFFCQATDSRINNATAVLRGLVYLLVDRQPSLLPHVRSEYDRAGELLCKDGYTWDALSRIFTSILRDPNLRMTSLVIDALDECVTDLPQLLDLIAQKSSGSSRVKWIVSSRNWLEIEERLETAAEKARLSLELNAQSVANAVNAYIRHKVDELAQLKKYDPNTRDTVQGYLSSNANGTFLWVALVCQALADLKVQKWHTLEKLRSFPPGLDSLYARMIDYIRDSEDSDLCKHILAVATIVRRPVSLQELTSLVEMPGGISDDRESLGKIIELCGSFLTLRDQTVYFVHQSAQDFLLGKAAGQASKKASQVTFGWVFPSGTGSVDHDILSRSLHAMSTALRRDFVRVPDPDPLATVRYSCVYWVDHLCDSVPGTNTKRDDLLEDDEVVHTFLKTKYLYWLEALSLLRAMPEGVIAIRQLEDLLVRIRLTPL
ncbi:NACHT domain-containing protein [Chaetomidium leptoderma]|uniref:NACHT domain-containing protein n=1 Tax=Chaetomidium leptoderma TaxID=669021 RepID=A0AAN6VFL5_9PEZI|nr:NACHT domain-containing protein [Chaetomidium leptoderma]